MCAHTPGLVGTANVFHLNSWLTFSHFVFLHSISHAVFCIGLGRVWNGANYFYLLRISCSQNCLLKRRMRETDMIMMCYSDNPYHKGLNNYILS